jgi:hypothetical protein
MNKEYNDKYEYEAAIFNYKSVGLEKNPSYIDNCVLKKHS